MGMPKALYRVGLALRQMDPSGKGSIVTSLELLFVGLLAVTTMALDTWLALTSSR